MRAINYATVVKTFVVLFASLLCGCETPCAPESAPPQITEYMNTPAILVFSGTASWRHNEGIAGADLFFARLAASRGYGFFTTENPAVFNDEDLARFELIVFNNVTGPILNAGQRLAFQAWLQDHGAWIGLHGTGDATMADWSWFQSNLIDTRFTGHTMGPQFQSATLVALATDHPILEGVAPRWQHTDEWYSFDRMPSPPGAQLLIGIDESSYEPRNTIVERWPRDLTMGPAPGDHPMVWAVCRSDYRGLYSALGHSFEAYDNEHYARLLTNTVDWAMNADREPCL